MWKMWVLGIHLFEHQFVEARFGPICQENFSPSECSLMSDEDETWHEQRYRAIFN